MFSRFVENTLEYYRNLFVLIILKGIFSSSNLRALVYLNPLNVSCMSRPYFFSLSYKGTILEKQLNRNCVFLFSLLL